MQEERNNYILITGIAGFIGAALANKIMQTNENISIIGIDNFNTYYDVALKHARIDSLKRWGPRVVCEDGDISNAAVLTKIFRQYNPTLVINLAAQAGVRYSITNPDAYVQSNLVGFCNILEACRNFEVQHLVYASSSSVYGGNRKTPYAEADKTDSPVSLYAATKKANELLAYAYSKLYGIRATGLRFFTVYGPMGRPDMAYFGFTDKLCKGETIDLYNHGNMLRDFTYIDDIVEGICRVIAVPQAADADGVPHKVYNIGGSHPEKLVDFVETLERCLIAEGLISQPGKKRLLEMQPGDVYQTYADASEMLRDFGFQPKTRLEEGLGAFAKWYKSFYYSS